jgi:hypothetical protein
MALSIAFSAAAIASGRVCSWPATIMPSTDTDHFQIRDGRRGVTTQRRGYVETTQKANEEADHAGRGFT